MDFLFDIEGFECDPLTRVDRDTPLHVAVRYANEGNADVAREMIEMMCEAGCDPRVKNKHGLKPADLILPHYKDIKSTLQRAEYVLSEEVQNEEAEDEESDGPSDSDEDEAAGNGNAVRNSRR
jgi:pentatricopeptide repeat protein